MKTVALAAALLAASLAAAPWARASGGTATGSGALQANASVDLRVVVPRILRLRTLSTRAGIEVGAEEAARGFATLAAAATIEVVCNLREYALRIDIVDPAVASVEIDGLDQPVRALPGGTTVYIPVASATERRRQRTLGYRVRYVPGTATGIRPLPVAISLGGA